MKPTDSSSPGSHDGRLPSGTVTFVLGDVVGSSAAWERDADIAAQTIATLDGIVRKLVTAHDGACPVEQGEGDNFVAAFARASDAVAFALEFQRAILAPGWPGEPPVVRVGLHTGDVRLADGCYRGDTLNRCSRIRSLANGGQVLVSGATAELVVDHLPEGAFLRDVGVHRLRDLHRPESLRQLCHQDLRFDFPPLESLDRSPHNLPLQLTTFVGRDREVAEVASILQRSRLVTLAGAGGTGKTRLALHAVANELDAYADGVWFIDLAPIREEGLVARAAADVLGVHEMPLEDVSNAVVRYLKPREALLVFDNCEHLAGGCATLIARLVGECAGVKVLATSREPLGVGGEQVFRVPSLELPRADLHECASVDLFIDRARAARSDLELTPKSMAAIADIVRRVDGLPLAIELTAARCRSLSPEQISARLDERFSLVSGGARGALARQRTLEASVQWSLDLLTDDERSLLLSLSVFVGGFSLDAAAAISGLEADDRWRVVDLVTSLVDRSLVGIDPSTAETRYRLLETVRFIAGEQLVASGEVARVRDACAMHFVELAQSIGVDLAGPRSTEAIRALDIELENVRAALTWLIRRANADGALALAVPLHLHWCRHASVETLALLDEVLSLDGGDPGARARLLVTAAEVAWTIGELERNAAYVVAVEDFAAGADDPEVSRFATLYRGWRRLLVGDNGADVDLLDASESFRAAGQHFWSSDAFLGLGLDAMWCGDLRGAAQFLRDSVQEAFASGHPIALARALAIQADVERERGDLARAAEVLNEVETIVEAHPDVAIVPVIHGLRALLSASAGAYETAIAESEAGIDMARRCGLATVLCQPAWANAVARYWSGETVGHDSLQETITFSDLIGYGWGSAACRVAAADLARMAGDLDMAERLVDEACEVVASSPHANVVRSAALVARSRLHRARGLESDEPAREALAVALASGCAEPALEAIQLLAACAVDAERFDVAARLLGAASHTRGELGLLVPPVFAEEITTLDRTLRTELGDEELAAYFADGMTLDLAGAQEYEARGRGRRRRPKVGWASLTPTELAVAELVASGRTNAQVAEQLFVSIPTVKTHLSHIFAKLGVANRAELAGAIATARADDHSRSIDGGRKDD